MANYKSGLFMGGMAQGISQGINWGTQLMDIRERKKVREAVKKEQEKITFQASELTKKLDQYGADGLYSENELLDIKTMMLSSATEVQERFTPIIENIEKGNTKEAEEQIKMIDEYIEYVFSLNLEPGQVEQTFNSFKNSGVVQSEQATRYLEAQENIVKRKMEARAMEPEAPQMEEPQPSKWQEFYDTHINKTNAALEEQMDSENRGIQEGVESAERRYQEEPKQKTEQTPGLISKGVDWFKGVLGGQQINYSKLSEEELKQAVLDGDEKAIEEARKRGFIK